MVNHIGFGSATLKPARIDRWKAYGHWSECRAAGVPLLPTSHNTISESPGYARTCTGAGSQTADSRRVGCYSLAVWSRILFRASLNPSEQPPSACRATWRPRIADVGRSGPPSARMVSTPWRYPGTEGATAPSARRPDRSRRAGYQRVAAVVRGYQARLLHDSCPNLRRNVSVRAGRSGRRSPRRDVSDASYAGPQQLSFESTGCRTAEGGSLNSGTRGRRMREHP